MKDPYGREYTRDALLARVADVLARSGVDDAGHLMAALQRVVPEDLPTSLLKALTRAQMNEADHHGLVFITNHRALDLLTRFYTGARLRSAVPPNSIFGTEVLVTDRFADDGDRLPGSPDHIARFDRTIPRLDADLDRVLELGPRSVVEYQRRRG